MRNRGRGAIFIIVGIIITGFFLVSTSLYLFGNENNFVNLAVFAFESENIGYNLVIEDEYDISDDCSPAYVCGEWEDCNFFSRTDDILDDKLIFEGVRQRVCVDSAECVESFVESEKCNLSVPGKVQKAEWCGEDIIEILDGQNNTVGRIKTTKVINGHNRVDIFLVDTGLFTYCDYCYDGEKNYDEESVDCGGAFCPKCIFMVEYINWAYIVSILFWGIFFLLFFIGLFIVIGGERFGKGLRSLIYFFKPLSREEALAREQKIKTFISLKKR
ncbi:MAG: hypothetical protein OQK82_06195 [Candidatus Pacearchaeota archaeon]|nr:hypothetical protein [Candidatus Pacearchaeota archaeon]